MTNPTFPLISLSTDGGFDLIPNELSSSWVSTIALIDPTCFEKEILFDSMGNKWTYRKIFEKFKNNWLTKVLAKTFYNPTHEAKIIWIFKETYSLEELKNSLKVCVDKDDDIITQYEEADVIKFAIDETNTFEEIIGVLNKYVFDVNEESLWKEQETRNK